MDYTRLFDFPIVILAGIGAMYLSAITYAAIWRRIYQKLGQPIKKLPANLGKDDNLATATFVLGWLGGLLIALFGWDSLALTERGTAANGFLSGIAMFVGGVLGASLAELWGLWRYHHATRQ